MGAKLDGDALTAVRRLRRHLTWWRLLAVVGFTLALVALFYDGQFAAEEDHIARVEIDGVIVGDEDLLAMLDEIAIDDRVKALVVDISSPGGTFTGGAAVFKALRQVADNKPVVTVMGDIATSGAYMTAIAADRVFAGVGTITASIGVIMQTADVTGLLDKIGITPEVIKSGALKATPNPMENLTDPARRQMQEIIDELHLRFMEMVAERRGLSVDEVRTRTGDGRVMTGSKAVENGLVDAIGDIDSARAWLAANRDIAADLPLYEWQKDDDLPWWERGADTMALHFFGKPLLSERLRLDGILALWHPSLSGGR